MRYRPFGETGLMVSEVGFGCARLGGFFSGQGTSDAVSLLRAAFDRGVTFYDTADMYTQGESERLVGQAFCTDRDRVIIASKVGYCLPRRRTLANRVKPLIKPLAHRLGVTRRGVISGGNAPIPQDFSPDYIVRAVEASLKRLGTDYLDLYQLHSPPPAVLEQGDFLAPLEQLKAAGKIRAYGVACERAEDALICLRYPEISAVQLSLSLLHQEALYQAIPGAAGRGVAVIARQCFASGLLAKPPEVSGSDGVAAEVSVVGDARRAELAAYHRLAEERGCPLRALALQFSLNAPGVSVTLVGLRTRAHLDDLLVDLVASS